MIKPFQKIGLKSLFLVWAYPQGSHRSQLIAQALGMPVEHVYFTKRQGLLYALLKYPIQAIKTPFVLLKHRPQIVFVQDPPIFGALFVYLWGLVMGTRFIIDSHSDALIYSVWTRFMFLHKFLEQRAIVTIVTNEYLKKIITNNQALGFILVDPPTTYPNRLRLNFPADSFNVVLVSTANHNEPIYEVLEAANNLPEVTFFITGNFDNSKHFPDAKAKAPSNVNFTGYIFDEAEFFGLLESCQIVMSLITEDHNIQSGAAEGLWLGKPVITSDWELLRSYYTKGSILVDNSATSIQQAIETIRDDLPRFKREILELREQRRKDWWKQANTLTGLILQYTQ